VRCLGLILKIQVTLPINEIVYLEVHIVNEETRPEGVLNVLEGVPLRPKYG
jgi:hypothetical protein